MQKSLRPVFAHAGHQYPDGMTPGLIRHRVEKDVHTGPVTADTGPLLQFAHVALAGPAHPQVMIPFGHDDTSRLHCHAGPGLQHLERQVIVDPGGEGCTEPGRDMLNDHDSGHVRAQSGQDGRQCIQSAGGGAECDQFAGMRRKRRGRRCPGGVLSRRLARRHGLQAVLSQEQHVPADAGGHAQLLLNGLGQLLQPFAQIPLRLGHIVQRAGFQGIQCDLTALFGEARYHDDRHGTKTHEIAQERQAVHARHFHIQRQHIRIQGLDGFPGLIGIPGLAHHLQIRGGVDDFPQQGAHER